MAKITKKISLPLNSLQNHYRVESSSPLQHSSRMNVCDQKHMMLAYSSLSIHMMVSLSLVTSLPQEKQPAVKMLGSSSGAQTAARTNSVHSCMATISVVHRPETFTSLPRHTSALSTLLQGISNTLPQAISDTHECLRSAAEDVTIASHIEACSPS